MARYRRGETPKLNPEMIVAISMAIREGVSVERAAADNGISKDTLYRWLQAKNGRYSAPLIYEFQREIRTAMDEARRRNLGIFNLST